MDRARLRACVRAYVGVCVRLSACVCVLKVVCVCVCVSARVCVCVDVWVLPKQPKHAKVDDIRGQGTSVDYHTISPARLSGDLRLCFLPGCASGSHTTPGSQEATQGPAFANIAQGSIAESLRLEKAPKCRGQLSGGPEREREAERETESKCVCVREKRQNWILHRRVYRLRADLGSLSVSALFFAPVPPPTAAAPMIYVTIPSSIPAALITPCLF